MAQPPSSTHDSPTATARSAPRFEVDDVLRVGGQAFVLARRIDIGGTFALAEASTLGGCRVVECLDLPADLRGLPSRHDSHVIFCLADAADAARIERGAWVDLEGATPAAPKPADEER